MSQHENDGASPRRTFAQQYALDREAGVVRSLQEYLLQFPGNDDAIAAEFLTHGRGENVSFQEPGNRIGPYRLLREIGRGGQGVVYLALDETLKRQVALKVLEGLDVSKEDAVARLRREALAASTLQHPGICVVYEAKMDAKTPYIAMQYVEGKTLASRIATTREPLIPSTIQVNLDSASKDDDHPTTVIEPPDPESILAAIHTVEKAARAIHAAHEAGIVHRDLKPGNIMVSDSGDPTILDFGLARLDDSGLATMTRSGDLFGTPAYMSPEQITRGSIHLDRRTDVWSLGVCLYELVTLRRPFDAPTREALFHAIQAKEPMNPRRLNPAIPRDLEIVIQATIEKDRDRRYPTALDFAEDLRRVREREPILARAVSRWTRLVRWVQRNPKVAALTLALSLSIAMGITASVILKLEANRNNARANLTSPSLGRLESELKAAQDRAVHQAQLISSIRSPEPLSHSASEFGITMIAPVRTIAGEKFNYRIKLVNGSSREARKILIENVLPMGMRFVGASDGGVEAAGKVTWALGSLPPGFGREVTCTVIPEHPGKLNAKPLKMVAVVRSEDHPESSSEAVTRVYFIPLLLLEVVDDVDPVDVGQEVTYTITVTNQSHVVQKDLAISVLTMEGLGFVSASGTTRLASAGPPIAGAAFAFLPVESLKPREKAVWTVKCKAERAGDWAFAAILTSQTIESPAEEREHTSIR